MQQLASWHKTKLGLLVFGVVELGLAYVIASLAINSGSLWEYALTLILLVGFLQNIVRLIGRLIHGSKHQTSKAR